MISIRLLYPLRFDHAEIPEGETIGVSAQIAHDFVNRKIAILAAPEHAVVEPQETRVVNRQRRNNRGSVL